MGARGRRRRGPPAGASGRRAAAPGHGAMRGAGARRPRRRAQRRRRAWARRLRSTLRTWRPRMRPSCDTGCTCLTWRRAGSRRGGPRSGRCQARAARSRGRPPRRREVARTRLLALSRVCDLTERATSAWHVPQPARASRRAPPRSALRTARRGARAAPQRASQAPRRRGAGAEREALGRCIAGLALVRAPPAGAPEDGADHVYAFAKEEEAGGPAVILEDMSRVRARPYPTLTASPAGAVAAPACPAPPCRACVRGVLVPCERRDIFALRRPARGRRAGARPRLCGRRGGAGARQGAAAGPARRCGGGRQALLAH